MEKYLIVRKDITWIIPASGDINGIYVYIPELERGFDGDIISFEGVDGKIHRFRGVWHSNREALYHYTGIRLEGKGCCFSYIELLGNRERCKYCRVTKECREASENRKS